MFFKLFFLLFGYDILSNELFQETTDKTKSVNDKLQNICYKK